MSTKTFGIYTSGIETDIKNDNELVVEMGSSHLACIVKSRKNNLIKAFELYNFNEVETLVFGDFFSSILNDSRLINKSYASTIFYLNNEFSLPIPATKFNKEIATDYLNIVFGEDIGSIQQYDHLGTEPDITNVFRIPEGWFNIIHHHLSGVHIHHSFTKIIKHAFATALNTSSAVINVQFYPSHLIVVVIKDRVLQFIQSFIHQSTDDVLYYLLNLTQRFDINTPDLVVHINGIIDLQSGLYNQLQKYFKNVIVINPDPNMLLIDTSPHPSHYFTPFFNLSV